MASIDEQSSLPSNPLRSRRLLAAATAALLSLSALALDAEAATISWTGAADGNWFNAANWSPAQVPASADDVVIDANTTVSVSGATSIAFATLVLGDAAGNFAPTLRLSAAQSTGGEVTIHRGAKLQQDTNQQIAFGALNVLPGGILTHTANSSARSFLINLSVAGDFDLQAGATIAASGLGYAGGLGYQAPGFGPGAGLSSSGVGGGGAHGGAGGKSSSGDAGGSAYDSATNPLDLGSGGAGSYTNGRGGAGGGAVLIAVGGAFSLNGQINVSGGAGTASGSNYGAGGGAGGTVNITAAAFNGTGSVLANGSAGVTAGNFGGGGGGGRIAVVVTGTDASNLNLQANGGAGGGGAATSGGAGVIALKTSGGINYNLTIGDPSFTPQSVTAIAGSTPTFSTATLNNSIVSFDADSMVTINNLVVSGVVNLTAAALSINGGVIHIKNGGILRLTAQSISGGHLLVDGGGSFQQMNTLPLGFASVLVLPGGMLTHAPNTSARSSVLNLNVTGDFDLQPGATIAASGLGYAGGLGYQAPGSGPGGGLSSSGVGGGGAHGGAGGKSSPGDAGGLTYDSATNPLDLGSGGAGSYTNGRGGAGGGAVLISVGGAFSLNGQINANGGAGTASGQNYGAGGGAGGTVNITATAFNGTGSILANGSAGVTAGNFGGGGGGGRIAVVVTGTDASNLNLQANGGTGGGAGATSGGAGVIALKTTGGVNYSLSIGDLTAVPQAGSGVGGTAPEFSTVTLNNSIVNFDPGSNVTINSLVVVGGAALSGHNFSFGSASPIQVRSGGSLKVTANQLTVPTGSPIEIQGGGSLALAVGVNSGGALIVRGGGTFQQLNAQTLNFDSVLVERGGLLSHAPNTSTRSSVLNLAVSGDFDLQAGATVSAAGLGYAGGLGYQTPGNGPGGGLSSSGVGGGGAHGGAGGKSSPGDAGGSAYDSATNPLDLGSGGAGSYTNGRGGAGGGAVLIAVGGAFSLNGQINANGGAGTASGQNYGAGGGAGGTVNITAAAFNGTGSVLANGSAGVTAGNFGGGGGGGRIAVVVTGTDASSLNLQANGGAGGGAGALRGGAGVIARKGSAALYSLTIGDLSVTPQSITPIAGALPVFEALTIGNSLVNFESGSTATIGGLLVTGAATVTAARLASSTLEVASGAALQLNAQATSGSLQVNAGGVFRQMNAVPLDFASVAVLTGGALTHAANSTARSSVVNLNVSGNFDLQAGATIAASGLGYAGGVGYQARGSGPGGGLSSSGVGGGGAHGGAGGKSNAGDAGGSAYDSATNPLDLGSGGAGSYTNGRGGAGGGAVLIAVGGAFSLNGQINVSGGAGTASGQNYGAGGGAGGTVNITAAAFNGTGSVLANGSAGVTAGNFGGGGGGGIVALTGCNSDLVLSGVGGGAAGGTGATAGGAGVLNPVVPGACPNAPPAPVNLAVSSMGQDASGSTFITATWDPAAQALSYVLQASTDSNFAGTVFVATSTVTTATVRGLTPNETYFLTIKAFNDIGFSNFSAAVSTLTPADLTAPQAPALTAASGRPAGVVAMSWQPSASGEVAAFYNVYRATEDFASTADLSPVLAFVSTTNATDLPPADGIYFYGITALDPSGNESPLSNRLSAASIHFANAPVSDLTATFHLEQKQIVLNWGAPSTGTPVSYAVYRTTFAASVVSPQDRLQSLDSLTFTDQPSLAIDATYYYRVTSLNAVSEESAPSNAAASVFDVHAPVIGFSGIADGQSTRFDVAPVVAIADFSPVVSTLTLNGQPFVASTTITGTFNQTVGEGGTASLSCSAGTILSFTSVWATSCGNPKNCGTCPLGGTSCTILYNNAQCGDVAPGCSKDGRLAITCGYRTTLTEPGTYILTLEAQDAFAHLSSASVNFTIDKAPPAIILTSPLDGDLLNQNVVVVFSSTDDFTPAAQVVVTDELGAVVTSPYVISAEGARALKLTARDLAGNSSLAEAAFILDKTPPLAVSDLRVTAADAAVGVATLAWTAPHDSLSGLAGYVLKTATFPINGANFASAQTIFLSTSSLPEGETESFVASVPTAQTVYFALKASDAADNLSAISNTALWDRTPPQVSTIDLQDGAVVSRPRRVTAVVTDDIAVLAVVFSVDNIVQSTVSFPPYVFDWDTRKFADGSHFLTIQATDVSGNTVQTSRSATVSYLPPAVPSISSPANGFTTNVSTISVSGLAEAGTTAQLLINGNLAASVFVAGAPLTDGAFVFMDVPLAAQGGNLVSVRALDSRGASANSPSIQVILLLGAPQIPSDLSAESVASGAIALSWVTVSTDTRTASYALYRSTDAALLPSGAAAPPAFLVATNITGSRFTDVPQDDGVYYYALTAIDLAGNQSGLSSPASAVSDRAAPTAEFRLTSATAPVGPGTYAAELSLSKVLAQPPLLTLAPFGASPSPLPLIAVTATLWRTTVTISATTPSGVAVFGFNGTDLVGNAGKTMTQGSTLAVDTRGPIGTVSLSKTSPVGPGPLDITLALDELAASTPSLSIALLGGSILPVSLVESSTDSRVWTGQVTITAATGDGSATLLYSAVDPLGNTSTLLTGGVTQLDIKTAPPGLPIALRATSLSGARVSLLWSAPAGDALAVFRVYRDGVFLSAVSPAADLSGSFLDTPVEGSYLYTVSAVDLAGNEGPTAAVTGRARATPPAPPVDLVSSINGAGQILLTWQAGSTDTARFLIYRTTAVIVSLSGIAPRDSVSPLTDLPTQDANYHYVVTALDDAGNESAPSAETVITFDRAGPTVDVAGVVNGGLYNGDVFPSFTASSLILDAESVQATLDNQTFLSGSPVSAEGSHTLVVTAANTRGRVSTATVTFAIDKTLPSIVLSGIQEGELLRSSGAISIAVTDANLGAVNFSLYNHVLGTTVTYRSGDLISRNGKYVLSGTAADLAGNGSTATLTFQLASGPLLPGNLSVLIQDGARLSWEQPEPGIVGYRAYRDGVRISGSFLNSLSFVDPAFTPGTAHIYEVSAVDAFGVEGPKARASVPAVDLSLSPITLTRGFFEEVRPALVNNSSEDAFIGPADVELVDATGSLVSAKASVSGVGAGRTGNLAATLATPATLPSAVSMRVTAVLQTDIGASVAIRKSIAVSVVDPPLPLVEVLPEALVPGTLSPVRIRLYNRGSAAMDIITASVAGSISNAVENVQVRLKSLDGSLLGTAGLNQNSGATAAIVGGRTVFFVRVPPGESVLFEPIRVVVPNTAAGNLLVEAVVSTPTFNLPSTGLAGTRGYQAQTVGAVVQNIPYTATVAPDKPVHDQGEQVVLTGKALAPDGAAVSSAAVVVHVTQGGFDRTLQAVTDLSGDYTVTFSPFTTEAGVYALASAHPDVVTRAIQSSFTIVGFGFNYRDFTATLAQNSSLPFTINLTNGGGAPLTGLTASTAAISVSGVTLTLDPASLPGTLAAGQTAGLRLTAAASPTALGGEMTFKVVESHGYVRTLNIRAQVAAAEAIPSASPQSFQVGMLSGQSRLQTITVTNNGFAPWRGVRLTPPTLDWVRIDGLLEIGDIPPGGNANFTLRIEPPLTLPTTAYAQNPLLEIQSLNAPTVPINTGITVTSSKQGTLVFNVINADKPRGADGLGVPVPGAVATLKSLDIAGLSFKVNADANGIIQFLNAPSGNYAWTLEADGFQPDAGTIELEPGLTKVLEKILATATIKYSWTVTPTTIVDKYDMALSVDFKTDVPAPIVVIDPTVITIDVPSHVDAFGQFTVTNLGLVSAMNVTLQPKSPDGEVVITLPFATIPELKPNQSVTVPFKISHGGVGPHCHQAAIAATYDFTCALNTLISGQCEPLKVSIGTLGGCLGPVAVSLVSDAVAGTPMVTALSGAVSGGAGVIRTFIPDLSKIGLTQNTGIAAKAASCACNRLVSLTLDASPPVIGTGDSSTLSATPKFAADGASENCEVTYKWGPTSLGTLKPNGASATFIAGNTIGSQTISVQGTDSRGAKAQKNTVVTISDRCLLSTTRTPSTQLIPAGDVTLWRTICPYDCPEPRTRTRTNISPPEPAAFPLCNPLELKFLMD